MQSLHSAQTKGETRCWQVHNNKKSFLKEAMGERAQHKAPLYAYCTAHSWFCFRGAFYCDTARRSTALNFNCTATLCYCINPGGFIPRSVGNLFVEVKCSRETANDPVGQLFIRLREVQIENSSRTRRGRSSSKGHRDLSAPSFPSRLTVSAGSIKDNAERQFA